MAARSEKAERSRRAASSASPAPTTETSLPRAASRTEKASSMALRFSSAMPKRAVKPASGSVTAWFGSGILLSPAVRKLRYHARKQQKAGPGHRGARRADKCIVVRALLIRSPHRGSLPREREEALAAVLDRLGDLLQGVLDGVLDCRPPVLVAHFSDDFAARVLQKDFHADPRVRHPSAPDPRSRPRLPGVEHIAFDRQLGPLVAGLFEPLFHVLLAGTRGLPRLAAPPVLDEFLHRDGPVLLQTALREVHPVGVLALRELVVVGKEFRGLVGFFRVLGVEEVLGLAESRRSDEGESETGYQRNPVGTMSQNPHCLFSL